MQIQITAFGIAKDILSTNKLTYELTEGLSVGELKTKLISDFEDFQKLKSLRFAVNEEYVEDHFTLRNGDEVILIPPVSGG
jgi:molybdopterin converting factor small subunit